MDPNFSVLLGDERRDECGDNEKENSKQYGPLIGGIVGGVVGLILISVIFIFVVYPRLHRWTKTRGSKKLSSSPKQAEGGELERM